MSVVDQQLYQQQKVPLPGCSAGEKKIKNSHCDILTFAFCSFPVIWWNQRYCCVSFQSLLRVGMNAFLSQGTWHCKITIPIYFYSVALLWAMLVQLPGEVFLLYFQDNVYTPLWRQPAFILLSTFACYFSCKATKEQQVLKVLLKILWYKECRRLWLSH